MQMTEAGDVDPYAGFHNANSCALRESRARRSNRHVARSATRWLRLKG
jgi:hypothetical protein